MTLDTEHATLPRMGVEDRGEQLRQLIEGKLGLNKSQAVEAVREIWPTFDYKTLGRVYEGKAYSSTMGRLEDWARRRYEEEHGGSVEGVPQTVSVDETKLIRVTVRNLRGAEFSAGEIVAEGGTPEEAAEAVAALMRKFGQQPADPTGDGAE